MHAAKAAVAGARNFKTAARAVARAATDTVRKGLAPLSVEFVAQQAQRMVRQEQSSGGTPPVQAPASAATTMTAPITEAGLLSKWASRCLPDAVFVAPEDGVGTESSAQTGKRAAQAAVAAEHGLEVGEVGTLPSLPTKSALDMELERLAVQEGTASPPRPAAVGLEEYLAAAPAPDDEVHKLGEGRTTLNTLKATFLHPFNARGTVDAFHVAQGRLPAHVHVEQEAHAARVSGAVGLQSLNAGGSHASRSVPQIVFGAGGKGALLGAATPAPLCAEVTGTLPRHGAVAVLLRGDTGAALPPKEALQRGLPPAVNSSVFDKVEDDTGKLEADARLEQRLLEVGAMAAAVGADSLLRASMAASSSDAGSTGVTDTLVALAEADSAAEHAATEVQAHQAAVAAAVPRSDAAPSLLRPLLAGARRHAPSKLVGAGPTFSTKTKARMQRVAGALRATKSFAKGAERWRVTAAGRKIRLPDPPNIDLLQRRYGSLITQLVDASIADKGDGEAAAEGARDMGVGFGATQAGAVDAIRFRQKAGIAQLLSKGPPNLLQRSVTAALRDFAASLPLQQLFPRKAGEPRASSAGSEQHANALVAALTGNAALQGDFNEHGRGAVRLLTSARMCSLVTQLSTLVYWKVLRAQADGTPMGLNAAPVVAGTSEAEDAAAEMDSLAAQASAPSVASAGSDVVGGRRGAGVHMDVTAEGEATTALLEAWGRVESELAGRGGASATTVRSLALLALKAVSLQQLQAAYPDWFALERSLEVYWRLYTTPTAASSAVAATTAAALAARARAFLADVGMPSAPLPPAGGVADPTMPLALREAQRLNSLQPFAVPRVTPATVQVDSYVARLLDPGRFGSSIAHLAAADDGLLASSALRRLHLPSGAFKSALYQPSAAPRVRAAGPQLPPSPRRRATAPSGSIAHGALPVPAPATSPVRVNAVLGSPHAARKFKRAGRLPVAPTGAEGGARRRKAPRTSLLADKLRRAAHIPSEASSVRSGGSVAARNTSMPTQPAMAAIAPLPPPKNAKVAAHVTSAMLRGALPVPAAPHARAVAARGGAAFHSRAGMVPLQEQVVELDTDICAQASTADGTALLGEAVPFASPVRASASVDSAPLLAALGASALRSYSVRRHAGYVAPAAAGVPVSLLSPNQRARLGAATLARARARYQAEAPSLSGATLPHGDRVDMLATFMANMTDAQTQAEVAAVRSGEAAPLRPRAFFDAVQEWPSDSEEEGGDRPTDFFAVKGARYTTGGDRIQPGVRDTVGDVERELDEPHTQARFDPSHGTVPRSAVVAAAAALYTKRSQAVQKQQTWGDYDAGQDPVAQAVHDKNDWYVEGIGRRTKVVDNPFDEAAAAEGGSAESKIDGVAALGIPNKAELLEASRIGFAKAKKKDMVISKVMRKRNPGRRALVNQLVASMQP